MVLAIFIAFISLIGLLVLHEGGHFILAKKFGVKVEEFGLGYPPRLFGRKIGETLYSINLLPFGAFVRIYGEEKQFKDKRSFFSKPVWQRALIIFGGVLSFWVAAAIILTFVMVSGVPTAVGDGDNDGLTNPKVQIAAVGKDSPAESAGIRVGDTIKEFSVFGFRFSIDKVEQVQEFTEQHKGEEINLTIERGKETFEVSLVPRINPPEGEGAMGVALVRTAMKTYPWYQAPFRGLLATADLTVLIVKGFAGAAVKAIAREPTGVQLMGPVGIFNLFGQMSQLGVNYFLQFIAIIAVHLAVINLLPIPAVDGGKLLFLAIEKVKGGPIKEKVEKTVTGVFFALLIALMVWVTIKDIASFF